MLHPGDQDLVTGPQRAAAPGLGDEVDRLRGAAREDHLAEAGRVQEPPRPFPCALEGIGGLLAQFVHPAVHIGVAGALVVVDGLDHGQRTLG